jgi:hypothetical protein
MALLKTFEDGGPVYHFLDADSNRVKIRRGPVKGGANTVCIQWSSSRRQELTQAQAADLVTRLQSFVAKGVV